MSAIAKLKAKFGAQEASNVVPLAGKNEPDAGVNRVALPPELADEVSAAANQQSAEAAQQSLAQVIASLDCAENQYGKFVLNASIGGRSECVAIDSAVGEDTIRSAMQAATGKIPPKSKVDEIKASLRIGARQARRQVTMHQRIARVEQSYVVDLGNPTGQAVRIGDGKWEVIDGGGTAFTRARGYAALPDPVRPKSVRHALALLLEFIEGLGISRSRSPMVLVVLVCWLKEGVTYPVLSLYGAPGGGKSTAALQLLMLVDPSGTGQLPNIGQGVDHIAAAAQMRHVLTIDNASKFAPDLQDTLCTCSTGGEILQRELYTNGEVAVLPIHRPVMLTSVSPVVTRPDLMSRTVQAEFTPREDRRSTAELMDGFRAQAGELFGALIELVAASTLPLLGEDSQGHRLHDFCIAGQRIYAAADLKPSEFMDGVDKMRASIGAEIAAGDEFVKTVRKTLNEFVKSAANGGEIPGWKKWFPAGHWVGQLADGRVIVTVRPKYFFTAIRSHVTLINTDGWMPRNEREMGNALVRSTPIFSDIGIRVTKREPSEGNAYWEFTFRIAPGGEA
jgi:hypothetical protein